MDKSFKRIIEKAEIIDKTDIKGAIIMQNPKDFFEIKGKLFFVKSEDTFYKNDGLNWLKLVEKETKTQGFEKEKIEMLIAWNNKFKEYVDNRFKEMELKQERLLAIVKENIDLKIKLVNKKGMVENG
jgi:hypothetical protein